MKISTAMTICAFMLVTGLVCAWFCDRGEKFSASCTLFIFGLTCWFLYGDAYVDEMIAKRGTNR